MYSNRDATPSESNSKVNCKSRAKCGFTARAIIAARATPAIERWPAANAQIALTKHFAVLHASLSPVENSPTRQKPTAAGYLANA